eukprot:1447860-Rhodomonas_salina.1
MGDGYLQVGDEVIGVHPWGGFAEEMLVPARNLVPKPKGMPFPEASGIDSPNPNPRSTLNVPKRCTYPKPSP